MKLLQRSNATTSKSPGLAEYRQGVEIGPNGDVTKALRAKLGPKGLPRGYRGDDAIPVSL
jgi:hypothetical protein